MQRITQSRHHVDAVEPPPEVAESAPSRLFAFVSLSRLVAGRGGLDDVLALSSKLIADVIPGVSGAWYIPQPGSDRLVAVDAFGPAASALRGASIDVGVRLTGWVAATRQPIVNSDAALDLGPRAHAMTTPLRACMSIPLTLGTSLIAVLTLYADAYDAFTGDEGRLVEMVAPHLASAIETARDAGAASANVTAERTAVVGGRELRLVSTR